MSLPRLALAEWEDTRLYLQLVCQMIGKTRLALHPPLNHWWHVALYLSARGLTTGGIPTPRGELDVALDLVSHQIVLRCGSQTIEVRLSGPICDVYSRYLEALTELGIEAHLDGRPYKCKSTIPFAEDRKHETYDKAAAETAFAVLSTVAKPFAEFRSRYKGKCSPVHMFWHSFDLACTRFSGRAAPPIEADHVTRAAYSDEVISAGFWFGDDDVPEAAFYCYAAPSPQHLAEETLPEHAEWKMLRGSPMALLRYEDVRKSNEPERTIVEFLQSSYNAAARLANWNRNDLEMNASDLALLGHG